MAASVPEATDQPSTTYGSDAVPDPRVTPFAAVKFASPSPRTGSCGTRFDSAFRASLAGGVSPHGSRSSAKSDGTAVAGAARTTAATSTATANARAGRLAPPTYHSWPGQP